MSSKFEHCPLNDCTSMVNNADNIMSSGYAKSAKAKSLPSAFFRKKNTNSTFTRENCKKSTKANELQQNEKVLCNESITSMETPKRKINREMENVCKVEDDIHVMHNSEKCQSKSEESIKEERLEKSQLSHAQELNNHPVSNAKLFKLNSNEQHVNLEENINNYCNDPMQNKQSSPETEEKIYEQKMRQVDDMQSNIYGDNAAHYYLDNTNNSVNDSNDAIDVNATNKFAGVPNNLNSINECLKMSNNNDILSPCDNKCQQYECLHYQQGQYEQNEEELNTDQIIDEKAETIAIATTTISEEENHTSDLLSSTPTPAHRNNFARYTRPLVQPLQRITEMPCHDGCHNPYSPSLLLDECACMAESSFYSCYSDSAETQRETDSCSSPDRWHHRCGDSTPTTSSQNITPTTTRAATVCTLSRCSLSEQSERCNNECMSKSAHYLLMRAPQSPQHVLSSLPHTTNYYTLSSSTHQSMTETQYDKENGVREHNNFCHNIDNKNGSTAMTDKPFEQCQGKHENYTLEETNKDEKLTRLQIEQEGTGVNMLEQERGCAKRCDTTENNGQLLEPQMSISADTCYSSADLFTPYRGIHEQLSWEPLHEENLSMTHNGVSRRLMWPSPLSPLSPSPSPTKTNLSAITTHYTQLNDPFSSSQQRSNFNSLNNISSSINDTFTNTNASNTSPTTTATLSTSTSPTTAMMMLKSMSRPSVTLHESVRSSHSHQPTTRVVKTIVQCGVDRSSGRPIPLRR